MGIESALELARGGEWHLADTAMHGCGIESVEVAGRTLKYINTGDTYDQTVCQEGDGEPFIGSWGGWYEEAEAKHCKEEGVVRCGYCSAFTPIEEGQHWSEVQCESCDHMVGG